MSTNEPDKVIRILSPITGMTFKIELNGEEKSLRELLGTILEIPSSSIRGIRDNYNNYYTLSSAINSKIINTSPSNYYSIVTENILENNDYDISKLPFNTLNSNYNNNFNNLYYYNNHYINNENLFFHNNRLNNMNNLQNIDYPKIRNNFISQNIIKQYNIKDYYNLINFLYMNNYINSKNYYKLKKYIEIHNQDVIEIMKPFIEFDNNYNKLINNLFPILNLDLSINDDFSMKKNSLGQFDAYKQILNSLKEYFTYENMKELNYLLLMENIVLIKIFKSYYKTRNKKNLIKDLFNLLKRIPNIIRSKSRFNGSKDKVVKQRKSKSQNYIKVSKKTNNYLNNLQNKKDKKGNKELLNEYTNIIIKYGKQFRKDIYHLMKYELKNITDEDKKKLFVSKFKIDLNKNKPELNNTNKKHIKNYYNKYLNINIYKFLDDDEKKIYENIIQETNSQEYEELLEIYNDLLKNSKSKNKIELLRNKIINYIKELLKQIEEEEMNEEEKEESKESKSEENKESKEKESEEDNIIKIETNEEEEKEDEDSEKNEEEKESSLVSSTVMVIDDEEEEGQNFEGSEESGVSIRKANRPRKN